MEEFIKHISLLIDMNILALGLISFVLGILIMLLDSILFMLRGASLLKISHKKSFTKDIPTILLWGLGSGIVGIIGGFLRIFNPEGLLQTSVFIAISWPLIFKNIIKKQNEKVPKNNKAI